MTLSSKEFVPKNGTAVLKNKINSVRFIQPVFKLSVSCMVTPRK